MLMWKIISRRDLAVRSLIDFSAMMAPISSMPIAGASCFLDYDISFVAADFITLPLAPGRLLLITFFFRQLIFLEG